MSTETAPAWRDTFSPTINSDTLEYKVKYQLPYDYLPKPGERMRIWQQGEKFVNINGGLRPIIMTDVREWEQAGLIVRW
jgi:hypothetical protein